MIIFSVNLQYVNVNLPNFEPSSSLRKIFVSPIIASISFEFSSSKVSRCKIIKVHLSSEFFQVSCISHSSSKVKGSEPIGQGYRYVRQQRSLLPWLGGLHQEDHVPHWSTKGSTMGTSAECARHVPLSKS